VEDEHERRAHEENGADRLVGDHVEAIARELDQCPSVRAGRLRSICESRRIRTKGAAFQTIAVAPRADLRLRSA